METGNTNKNKIVVIGAGRVGEAVAYTLILSKRASDIVLIDVDKERAEGSALDIGHGIAFYTQATVREGDYTECADASIIIITAGMARKPGQTRLDLARSNVSIVKDITKNIMEYAEDPIIIVISNPVDVLTYVVQHESGLPANRVIGTGTLLDTARFRYLLSQKCDVDIEDIDAYVLGEHGDSQVPVWSAVSIAGIPLRHYCSQLGIDIEKDMKDIDEEVKTAGSTVIQLKGATYLGIALNTSKIVDVILENDNTILPVCHVIKDDVYGVSDVATSLPCVINKTGVVRTLKLPLTTQEALAMHESSKTLKDFTQNALSVNN
ncbi:MAG: L-lactate dehydrogenase [Christensenellaceae bacterium]